MSDDGLFPAPDVDIFAGLETRSKKVRKDLVTTQKSVAFGACPDCSAFKVGLIRQGAHLVWRDHSYRTHGGTSLQCRAVAVTLCSAPARSTTFSTEVPTCPCGN